MAPRAAKTRYTGTPIGAARIRAHTHPRGSRSAILPQPPRRATAAHALGRRERRRARAVQELDDVVRRHAPGAEREPRAGLCAL